MDLLKNCSDIYKNYVGYEYTFITDYNYSVKVRFAESHFYHLAGLHYLKDIKQLDTRIKNNNTTNIFKRIQKEKITHSHIQKSVFYKQIEERLVHFLNFDNVISAKIIVDFDYAKVYKTSIMSKYLLYKQYEDGYEILGLKYDTKYDVYIPETFIVEHSDYYIKEQMSYNIVEVKTNLYKK